MNDKKEYAEKLRLLSQKYIYPIYLKDELDNLKFAGTLTLVKYQNRCFGITAEHVIDEKYKLDKGIFINGTSMMQNIEIYRYERSDKLDLLIISFMVTFDNRYYFNLDDSNYDLSKYLTNAFLWIGFPYKKAINFYKKNPDEEIKKTMKDGLIQTSRTLLAAIAFKKNKEFKHETEIVEGFCDLKNAEYSKEGKKSQGYSFIGMSGGAFCIFNPNTPNTQDILLFIGMGIEHRKDKDKSVIGIGRTVIVNKLKEIVEKPINITISLDDSYGQL